MADEMNVMFEEGPTAEELEAIEAELDIADVETGEEDYYSEDCMKQIYNQIGRIPLLSPEEEKHLGKLIMEGSESEAKEAVDKLVISNLRLVAYVAKKYVASGIEEDELNSMGWEGLTKAAKKFDYTKGYKFSTYAYWWIWQAIIRGIPEEENSIHLPTHVVENAKKANRIRNELRSRNGAEPTLAEIAEAANLSEKKTGNALRAQYKVCSMDSKLNDEDDTTLKDILADDNATAPEDFVVNKTLAGDIRAVLATLPENEARVLSLRHGLDTDKPMTLDQIGELPEFGVTRERIRQIEMQAYKRIRRSSKSVARLSDYVA